jgi:hypothetical protein
MIEGGATHIGVATDHVIESFRKPLLNLRPTMPWQLQRRAPQTMNVSTKCAFGRRTRTWHNASTATAWFR